MNLIEAWTAATDAFGLRLAEVDPADESRPTPCDEWSIAELIDHVFEIQTRLPTALGHAADVHEHNLSGWQSLCGSSAAIFDQPGNLERTVTSSLGEMPASDMLSISLADCLTHTWDLARALDVDDTLPEGLVGIALDFMRPLDELLRGPGMLDDKVAPPDGAGLAVTLICFAGRDPSWNRDAR